MSYGFFALISRLKNITRWSLMRNSESENVQEHSHMVAVIAHALAVVRRDVLGLESNPEFTAAAALFHDASEIFTGDLPTPIKYFNADIMSAYKSIELTALKKLIATLPPEMRPAYENLFSEDTGRLIKAADKLAAYIKCVEELKAGNTEFKIAAEHTKEKLFAMNMPEVTYFMEHFMPAFDMTLDELKYTFGDMEE